MLRFRVPLRENAKDSSTAHLSPHFFGEVFARVSGEASLGDTLPEGSLQMSRAGRIFPIEYKTNDESALLYGCLPYFVR